MELSEERDIIEEKIDELNEFQKEKLYKLDEHLLEIYSLVKDIEFEKLFLSWFSQYFPISVSR